MLPAPQKCEYTILKKEYWSRLPDLLQSEHVGHAIPLSSYFPMFSISLSYAESYAFKFRRPPALPSLHRKRARKKPAAKSQSLVIASRTNRGKEPPTPQSHNQNQESTIAIGGTIEQDLIHDYLRTSCQASTDAEQNAIQPYISDPQTHCKKSASRDPFLQSCSRPACSQRYVATLREVLLPNQRPPDVHLIHHRSITLLNPLSTSLMPTSPSSPTAIFLPSASLLSNAWALTPSTSSATFSAASLYVPSACTLVANLSISNSRFWFIRCRREEMVAVREGWKSDAVKDWRVSSAES